MTAVVSRIARNLVWLGTGEVLLKGALFAAGVVVARGLGESAMGVFTVAFGAALVLMQILAGGQVEVLIREIAQHSGAARSLYQEARSWQRRLAVVVVPAALLAAAVVVREESLRWTLLAFVPYGWLRAWLITAGAVFKGQDRMDVEVGARTLEVGLALGLLVLAAGCGLPVWMTGAAFSGGAWAGTLWIVARVGRLPLVAPSPVTARVLARQGAPFLLLSVFTQVLVRGDVMLQAALGEAAAETGLYGAAAAAVWGLFGVTQLLAVASYPTVARWSEDGTLSQLVVLALAGGGVLVGAAGASLLYLMRMPLILGFFGMPFGAAVPLLEVLVWLLPGACAATLLGVVVAARRRQALALAVQCGMVTLALAGNLWLIPVLGVAGSARVAVAVHTLSAVAMTVVAVWAAGKGPREGAAGDGRPLPVTGQ